MKRLVWIFLAAIAIVCAADNTLRRNTRVDIAPVAGADTIASDTVVATPGQITVRLRQAAAQLWRVVFRHQRNPATLIGRNPRHTISRPSGAPAPQPPGNRRRRHPRRRDAPRRHQLVGQTPDFLLPSRSEAENARCDPLRSQNNPCRVRRQKVSRSRGQHFLTHF